MKPLFWGLGVVIFFLAHFLDAQVPAPPNDNFTNRTVLIGTNVSFTGTLAGATVEMVWNGQTYVPEITGYPVFNGYATQSVWWTWTPDQSTTAIVQILHCSNSTYRSDGLVIYNATNSAMGNALAGIYIDSGMPYRYFTFHADAGTNYQIQLVGSDGDTFALKLIATDLPYLIQQPENQTVTAGDSVLFTSMVAGMHPFTYQWQFNGTNLPGETAPMLALDNVATNQSGLYRILVTNSAGVTFSDSASLLVTTTDMPSTLTAYPNSTHFAFSLLGEAGRRYRIESSTNLSIWLPEFSFPSPIFYNADGSTKPVRSVVLDVSGADVFTVTNIGQSKFFRAHDFHAANEVCNNNIKQIRFAQLLFACDNQRDEHYNVTFSDLAPYFKNGQSPGCPSNGVYSILSVLSNPSCSTGYHPFEEP